MGEIIELREFQAARERAQRRRADHANIAQALTIMRENLAAVADAMRSAPEDQQPELLDRLEKLTALLRYGMRMMGDPDDPLARNS